jgi:RNA polymerase-binding protein DksA
MAERSKAADNAGTGGTGASGGSGLEASAAPRRKRAASTARGGAAAGKRSGAGTRSAARKSVEEPPTAAGSAAKGATMVKSADTRPTARKPAAKGTRTAAETEKIRAALSARRDELRTEYDQTLTEITELQRDRLTDSAGDDQADTGTKTFEREQEISLANSILDRITQVERALERLDDGSYGWCERCGNPIPVERLAAFPSATLCVSCKQLEERR